MKNLMDKLKKWQQVVIALFFGVLGALLWIFPFFIEGKEMVKGEDAEWANIHWIFILFGTIAIAISVQLSRIGKLFDIGTGFLSKFTAKNKEHTK